jgi:hypothetical protein
MSNPSPGSGLDDQIDQIFRTKFSNIGPEVRPPSARSFARSWWEITRWA